jgi:hypothetical protein
MEKFNPTTEKISITEEEYFKSSNVRETKSSGDVDLELDKLMIHKNSHHSYIPFPSDYQYSKNDFQVLELLGKGAYAKVVKAKCLKDNEIKAIKIIDKYFMERVK